MDVVDRAMEKGRLEEVLVRANMPLALKGKIVQDLEKRGEGYRQAGGRVGFIHEGVYSDYVYYFLLLPVRVAGTD